MVKGWVSLLAVSIVWIFGTLPWIMINDVLCSYNDSLACPNRTRFWQKAEIILAADVILIVAATLSIKKLIELEQAK